VLHHGLAPVPQGGGITGVQGVLLTVAQVADAIVGVCVDGSACLPAAEGVEAGQERPELLGQAVAGGRLPGCAAGRLRWGRRVLAWSGNSSVRGVATSPGVAPGNVLLQDSCRVLCPYLSPLAYSSQDKTKSPCLKSTHHL
jgi:hypothetical protein